MTIRAVPSAQPGVDDGAEHRLQQFHEVVGLRSSSARAPTTRRMSSTPLMTDSTTSLRAPVRSICRSMPILEGGSPAEVAQSFAIELNHTPMPLGG